MSRCRRSAPRVERRLRDVLRELDRRLELRAELFDPREVRAAVLRLARRGRRDLVLVVDEQPARQPARVGHKLDR
jgi:hypothetical protein